MPSPELFAKYNQVIRPYYAQLYRNGIHSIEALDEYLESYSNDTNIIAFLKDALPQVQEVFSTLDEANRLVFEYCLKVRFFNEAIAATLAQHLTTQLQALDLIRLGEAVRSFAHFSINNVKDYFNQHNLVQILSLALAAKVQVKIPYARYALPNVKNGTLVDMNPEPATLALLQAQPNLYKQLYTFAYTPAILSSLVRNQNLRSVVTQHTIFKSLLSSTPAIRIYFDRNGNAYRNSVPSGVSKDDYYITRTFFTTIKETNADLIKFALTPDILGYLLSSDSSKAIVKNKVNLLAVTNFVSDGFKSTANFDLQETFGDCFGIAALVKHMSSLKLSYDLQLQYEASSLGRLQLLFSVHKS